MADDVLLNKAAAIERYVARAKEEYQKAPETFASDYTRQDAAIFNILRACEATLDMGQHVVRLQKLGLPQSTRDVFDILAGANVISTELADRLKRMVGFRNIAVHEYQKLQMPITINIIEHHLDEFLDYSRVVLRGQN